MSVPCPRSRRAPWNRRGTRVKTRPRFPLRPLENEAIVRQVEDHPELLQKSAPESPIPSRESAFLRLAEDLNFGLLQSHPSDAQRLYPSPPAGPVAGEHRRVPVPGVAQAGAESRLLLERMIEIDIHRGSAGIHHQLDRDRLSAERSYKTGYHRKPLSIGHRYRDPRTLVSEPVGRKDSQPVLGIVEDYYILPEHFDSDDSFHLPLHGFRQKLQRIHHDHRIYNGLAAKRD